MKKSNVYTRTGDQGQTSLADGTRISKYAMRLDCYGEIDELNSHVGLLVSHVKDEQVRDLLLDVQRTLFIIGAMLATPSEGEKASACSLTKEHVQALEQNIDRLHDGLPAWRGFTLPGGCIAASQAQVCRTVCRRAERRICRLSEQEGGVDSYLLAYVNRLSDMFYVLALYLNNIENVKEILWSVR
ncbi:MAG: cob(I)yrinic acid a,c-diamide adenosyltransferase [Bacteroidaceae bacterium]